MEVFLDTEFTGLHKGTTLISIGLVANDGRYFYAELNDYDRAQVDEWIQENVINNLTMRKPKPGEDEYYTAFRHINNPAPNNFFDGYSIKFRGTMNDVKCELTRWLQQFDKVEIWSDCLAYDWVLFNDIWGHALKIPSNIYYIPFDICTLFKMKGIDPDINREAFAEVDKIEEAVKHCAIWDAQVIMACYNKLIKM